MNRPLFLFVVIVLGGTLIGCGQRSNAPAENSPTESTESLAEGNDVQNDTDANSGEADSVSLDAQPMVENSIVIGLDADMTSGSARSGEAIRRGIAIAIDEINTAGGVLGRPFELIVRDHRGNPARGIDNIVEFGEMDRVAAVVGGIHTPVALAELETIHQQELVYLGPWAAGTSIVDNGFDPNYVFRVSVRDEFAGGYLVQEALDRGYKKLGLMLEQTGWGQSNEKAIKDALTTRDMVPAGIEWFHWGAESLDQHIDRLADAGAEAIILVCNPLEGIGTVQSMAKRAPDDRIPIVSHWGISAGAVIDGAAEEMENVDLVFLQTYSFLKDNPSETNQRIVKHYCEMFSDSDRADDIFAPVGTAHAYDVIHLLRLAIEKAQSTEGPAIREALENLDSYTGLVRTYNPPFSSDKHDALDVQDFCLAEFGADGVIRPIGK